MRQCPLIISSEASDSIHHVIIVKNTVYGSIYLKEPATTLYVAPIYATDHSIRIDECHCEQSPNSQALSFVEFIISTTQQRLLDDGILEIPSVTYNFTSYDMVSARTSIYYQMPALISQIPLIAARKEDVTIHFSHPHEVIAAKMEGEECSDDCLCLVLSEVGTHCHATLVATEKIVAEQKETSVNQSIILFQDKFRILSDIDKTPSANKNKRQRVNKYISSEQVFLKRLATEVSRGIRINKNCTKNSWTWENIGLVYFIDNDVGNNNDIQCDSISASKNMQEWLINVLQSSMKPQAKISSKKFASFSRPFDDCLFKKISAEVPLGSAIGVRVNNFVTTEKGDKLCGNENHLVASFHECNDFIPILEPFHNLPVCIRRRLRGTRCLKHVSPESSNDSMQVKFILDVVEDNRCDYGSCEDRRCGRNGNTLNRLLTGALDISIKNPVDGDPQSYSVELDVEISVDTKRHVTVRVFDTEGKRSFYISTSFAGDCVEPLPDSDELILQQFRRVNDQFVKNMNDATCWSSNELSSMYKQRGNDYMKLFDYVGAIDMYNYGLSCSTDDTFGVFASNR